MYMETVWLWFEQFVNIAVLCSELSEAIVEYRANGSENYR